MEKDKLTICYRMKDIFKNVTGLFPSIYMWKDTADSKKYNESIVYIQAVLNETRRILKQFSLKIPVYAYTSVELKTFPEPTAFYDEVRSYSHF